jgi:hypothetical protein
MGIQTIVSPAGDEMVVMARSEYEQLVASAEEAFEDGADAAAYAAAKAQSGPEDALPAELTAGILAGHGRLRTYREWRGMTIEDLAAKLELPLGELHALEDGSRLLDRETAARVTVVLDIPASWLAL